jgi:hypothetical protein
MDLPAGLTSNRWKTHRKPTEASVNELLRGGTGPTPTPERTEGNRVQGVLAARRFASDNAAYNERQAERAKRAAAHDEAILRKYR